jgi:DNA-binding NtrC family response regulator
VKARWQILVVDDEAAITESLAAWLREDGYSVDTASSGQEAIEKARLREYAIYFIDLKMPGGLDGIETMTEVKRLQPAASVIVITAYATVDTAVTAMKEGAQEYVVKPCYPQEISLLVERIIRVKKLERENDILRRKLRKRYGFQDLVSKSPRMVEIFELVREIASQRSTVLIRGESGTGKELVARAIHFSGERSDAPFVGVSCAALAESLLESELFGHEKGAFTGAVAQKKGKFELADGGTLFLDEIGDISPKLQVDLLRVLQERRFFRVGGTDEITVDVRVIAATHRDLAADVREGRFRGDLYYRLNVINIVIPPLRERREDIPLLAQEFLSRLSHELGRNVTGISEEALRLLMDHDWPGNVRELANAVERAVVTCKTRALTAEDLDFLRPAATLVGSGTSLPAGLTLQQLEKEYIALTLERLRGNMTEAAAALGIDRSTLYEKVKRYEIPR